MKKVLLATYMLGTGGKTSAIFRQANLLSGDGYDVSILTFGFHRNFGRVVEDHHEQGALDRRVSVENAYFDAEEESTRRRRAGWSNAADADAKDLIAQDDRLTEEGYIRYFNRSGEYIKFRRWDDEGTPLRTTYFRSRRPFLRREYGKQGYCNLQVGYDPVNGEINVERYMTRDGFCYLSRWLNSSTGSVQGVFRNDRVTQKSVRYNNDVGWHVDWLRTKIAEAPSKPVIVAHSSGVVRRLLRIAPESAQRVFVFHENHLARPFQFGARIRTDYEDIFKHFVEMENVVVATSAQAKDLEREYDCANIDVIAPFVVEGEHRLDPKEMCKVGVFTRLVPSKQVDHLIRVASAIRAQHPTFSLHIFGSGPEASSLRGLVSEMEAAGYVHFHGRTNNARYLMAGCAITCSVSEVESFGLSIAESLSAGTPVVAYNINYGPGELIRNGENGWLIERNSLSALRDTIIEALSDAARLEKMGELASSMMRRRFTREHYLASWRSVLEP